MKGVWLNQESIFGIAVIPACSMGLRNANLQKGGVESARWCFLVGGIYTRQQGFLDAYDQFRGYCGSSSLRTGYFSVTSPTYLNAPVVSSPENLVFLWRVWIDLHRTTSDFSCVPRGEFLIRLHFYHTNKILVRSYNRSVQVGRWIDREQSGTYAWWAVITAKLVLCFLDSFLFVYMLLIIY